MVECQPWGFHIDPGHWVFLFGSNKLVLGFVWNIIHIDLVFQLNYWICLFWDNFSFLGFCSSFNDKPVNEAAVGPIGKDLFEKEQDDLLADLIDIPKKACDRRVSSPFSFFICFLSVKQNSDSICVLQINEFVKRARAAKIHAYIISHLKKEMPAMMGKAKAQQRLTDNLEDEFAKVATFLSLCLSLSISIYMVYIWID